MKLYLDLNKATSQATGGITTKKEEQSVASAAESYVESTSGVSGDAASYDNPKVGKDWSRDEESLDDAVEAQRQKRNQKAQQRNLVPTKEEVGIKKAFEESSIDMVKSLTGGLRDALSLNRLTAPEIDFLHTIKGYSIEDIKLGKVAIVGKDRRAFSAFLCERVAKSIDDLNRR